MRFLRSIFAACVLIGSLLSGGSVYADSPPLSLKFGPPEIMDGRLDTYALVPSTYVYVEVWVNTSKFYIYTGSSSVTDWTVLFYTDNSYSWTPLYMQANSVIPVSVPQGTKYVRIQTTQMGQTQIKEISTSGAINLGKPNVHVTGHTSSTISIAWNTVSGAAKYRIYVGPNPYMDTYSTSATISGLNPYTTYDIAVAAVNSANEEGPKSDYISVRTDFPAPPSAPTGLRMVGSTQTSVSLAWDPVPGAVSYTMLRDEVLENPNITGTSYTLTGLEPGHMYQISLSATDSYGQTGPATTITVSTQTPPPPGAPTGLHVTGVTTSSVSLAWDSQTGAVKYGVYRDGQHVATVTGTQYTDTGLASGTQYRYSISSIDGWNQEGPQSAPVTASTETPPPPPPAAPTGLRVTGSTQTSISVAWNPVAGAQTYTVYVNGSLYQAGVQGTTYTVTGLQPATQYSISVSATDAWGQEGTKASVTGQTQLPDLLGAPGGLQATNATSTTVSLSWSPVQGATGYAIYRDGLRIAKVSDTSYTDAGLAPSSTHTYTVAAIDAWGREGAKAPGVQVTTLAFDLKPPTTVQKTGCTLTWTPAPGTPAGVTYVIYRSGIQVGRTQDTSWPIPDCSNVAVYTVAVEFQGVVSTPSQPVGGIGIDSRTNYGFTPSDLWTTTMQIILSLGSIILLALAIWLAPRLRDTLIRLYERRRQERERWWV